MVEIDRSLFPRTAAYIDALPDGLDSYPECTAKASMYLSALEIRPFDPVPDGALPPEIIDLVARPRTLGSWVLEARFQALMFALREQQFTSDEAFFDFIYDRQCALFESRLYSILIRLASPGLLLRGASMRWSSFHRGTTLQTLDVTGSSATLMLEYPPYLFEPMAVHATGIGFKAALDVSRARNSSVEAVEILPDRAGYEGRWD